MKSPRVGFIGLGEVATALSRELFRNGAEVKVFDTLSATPEGYEILKERIRNTGVKLEPLEDVIGSSQYVLSTVPTQEAMKVAKVASPYLRKGIIYIDMNSTSPAEKREIGKIVEATGGDYVEAAILGAIGAGGPKTRIIVAGPLGKTVAKVFTSLGLNLEWYSEEIGKASLFKMLRSVFSKGLECIILELLIAGRRAGIEKDLWQEVCRFMKQHPFNIVADNWVRTHPVASQRRYYEMVQVNETIRNLGLESVMSKATESFFLRSFELGICEVFKEKQYYRTTVIEFLETRIGSEVIEEQSSTRSIP